MSAMLRRGRRRRLSAAAVSDALQPLAEADLARLADDDMCPICLDPLVDRPVDALTRVRGCGHVFCSACLHTWFGSYRGTACPACKREIPPADGEETSDGGGEDAEGSVTYALMFGGSLLDAVLLWHGSQGSVTSSPRQGPGFGLGLPDEATEQGESSDDDDDDEGSDGGNGYYATGSIYFWPLLATTAPAPAPAPEPTGAAEPSPSSVPPPSSAAEDAMRRSRAASRRERDREADDRDAEEEDAHQ